MAEQFTFFWKHRLSQWQHAPFVLGGITFTHAEQYMMYAKALLFSDREAAGRILAAETPREQQEIGRRVRGYDESVWVLFREGIVFTANYARFSQNEDQRELLFSTRGTTLVEASPHDRIWGIGLSADDPRARDRSQWLGLNLLGEVLMRVREALLWTFEFRRGIHAS
ncbi:NADAR family protein [Telmatocola sphagniphila]|uniref:NADAR family protein n=1 Tax=Telmatocola sphagniphila TaxID=1123043 RepID=A0A8E6B6E4_9BACT|nr:NADAR family protein [Telmatocola sphagniphila]QVL31383.1 NADAR family protein [Telmatocola sphagniphila]